MNSQLSLFWTHSTGYVAGFEWTIKLAAGGHTQVIPRPTAPLVAEWAGVSPANNEYVVSISGEGTPNTFTYSVNGAAVGTDHDIVSYSSGNTEIGTLRLRFYSTTGFKIG